MALALVQGQANEHYIKRIDDTVTNIAGRIINPGLGVSFILGPVRRMENKEVSKIILLLKN